MSSATLSFVSSTALLPIALVLQWPPDTMLLIYTIFVIAFLCRKRLVHAVVKVRLSPRWKFYFLMVASGFLAEVFAWVSNYTARGPQPALSISSL